MPDLSVVIPAYREEALLASSMGRVQSWLAAAGIDGEVVLVTELSPDRTQEVGRELAKRYPNVVLLENEGNMGKGYTVKRGLLRSSAHRAAFIDADLSIPVEDLSSLLNRMDETGADAVVGRRAIAEGVSPVKVLLSWGFRTLNRLVNGMPLRETQCGCKLFTRAFIEDVFPLVDCDGFGFDVDVLAIGLARGWRIAEADVRRVPVAKTPSVRPFRDSWDMFWHLFRSRAAAKKYACSPEGR